MDEEYELTPYHELEELKNEIEKLKHSPLGETPSGNELLRAVQELNQSVKALTNLFKIAAEQLETGKNHEEDTLHKFDPMVHKINELIDQNKKIAAGIVSVADLVKEKTEQQARPAEPETMAPRREPMMNAPAPSTMEHMPPPDFGPVPDFNDLSMPDFGSDSDLNLGPPGLPPMPEEKQKKKGLFKL